MFLRLLKFILSCLLLLLLVFILSNLSAFAKISLKLSNLIFESKILVIGNQRVSEQEIRSLLPDDIIVWSWRFNSNEISESLKKIPIIRSSAVKPCSFYSLNCYEIHIQEYDPKFILDTKNTSWFMSEKLTYMFPMPKYLNLNKEAKRLNLTVIKLSDNLRDESVRQAISYAYSVLTTLKDSLSLKISEISFQSNGEFKVLFYDQDFSVSFSELNGNFEKLKTEILRLQEVLGNSEGKLHVIEGIDLAYDKMAIVKFREIKK